MIEFKRKVYIPILGAAVLGIVLSGCAGATKQMMLDQAFGGQTSKYQPILTSESRIETYKQLIAKNNKKVVSDNKGTYYHRLINNDMYRVYFNSTDSSALQNVFQKGKGLLSPVYTYQFYSRNHVGSRVDWSRTKRLYNYLRVNMNLNLLPFSETKRLHQAYLNSYGEYNSRTDAKILKKLRINADYIVQSGLKEDFFNNKNDQHSDKKSLKYSIKRLVTQDNFISFKPIQLVKSSKSGYVYMETSCMAINYSNYADVLEDNLNSMSEINRQYSRIKRTSNRQWNTLLSECKIGMRKMGITGKILSDTLD